MNFHILLRTYFTDFIYKNYLIHLYSLETKLKREFLFSNQIEVYSQQIFTGIQQI